MSTHPARASALDARAVMGVAPRTDSRTPRASPPPRRRLASPAKSCPDTHAGSSATSSAASWRSLSIASDRQSGTDRSSADADSPGTVANVTTRGAKAGGGGFQITMPPAAPAAPAPSAGVPPPPPPPPPASLPSAELEEKLTALEVEYETALASLKADFAARKAAVIEQHASSSEHANGGALSLS